METGSLVNLILGQGPGKPPIVGDGVTELCWTDRQPYTIVEVVSPRELKIQADNARRVDTNGASESQDYEYTSNPKAPVETIVLRKSKKHPAGKWVRKGARIGSNGFCVGRRERYHDFSF